MVNHEAAWQFFSTSCCQHYSIRPFLKKKDIEDAFKLIGVKSLWDTIKPNNDRKDLILSFMFAAIKRRNQIAHEGDRFASRKSGKKLRPIIKEYTEEVMAFCEDLVLRSEWLVVI